MTTELKKAEKKKVEKKRRYYIEEFTILLVTLLSVVFSDAIMKRASGELATTNDILFDWVNLIVSGILAVVSYGTMFTQFQYSNKTKPPLIKRIATAIMNGIAWRTIIGWTK